jgi:hypothetical protein
MVESSEILTHTPIVYFAGINERIWWDLLAIWHIPLSESTSRCPCITILCVL